MLIRMNFLVDNIVLNACAPRNGSSGLPERIKIKKVLRVETGSARSCATAFLSILLGCGDDEGRVCQLPTQSTNPWNLRRLFWTASTMRRTPQIKCFSFASQSGGGPSTSVTHRTPAAFVQLAECKPTGLNSWPHSPPRSSRPCAHFSHSSYRYPD